MKSRFKADLFFFGLIVFAQLFMMFGLIKQMNTPVFKVGLKQSSEILTKNIK